MDAPLDLPPIIASHARAPFRLKIRHVLPIAFFVLVICPFIGMIPPIRVSAVLAVGILSGVLFSSAKKPRCSLASVTITLLFAMWLLRPLVVIRPSNSGDRVYEQYFGFEQSHDKFNSVKTRNIAVASGTFTLRTWLSATLYYVNSGNVVPMNSITVGRTPNAIPAPYWQDLKITFALSDRRNASGRFTALGSAGQTRGGGNSGEMPHDAGTEASRCYPVRLSSGSKAILYVEGDLEFTVNKDMSVEQFARENKGKYLVVEVRLN